MHLLRRRDDGVALPTVLISMVVVSLFAMTALGYALQSQRGSRDSQDWNAALAAAQAGVEDYIGYLNRNDNYAKATTEHCSNIALQIPAANGTGNNCPTWSGAAVGWKPVDGGDPNGPAFHYDIDTTRLSAEGVILVTSTGRSRGERRTLEVGVGRSGSSQFLYFTDREDADPDNRTAYPTGSLQPSTCDDYWYNGRSGCQEITFIGGDVLDGAVHTNDAPLFTALGGAKPSFPAGLSTSFPSCKDAVAGQPSTYKKCDRTELGANYGSSVPRYADRLQLADNSDAFANYPGCQYRGATRIKFLNTGQMQVWSKDTDSGTSACGGNAPNGALVPVPTDQVIYVRDSANIRKCKSQEIGDALPVGTFTGNTTAEHTYDRNMEQPTYQCGKGNVYIEGPLRGRVTVAASENVVVTGDLVMAGGLTGSDMLGLVAANSVAVYHPRLDTWRKSGTTWGYAGAPAEVAGWPRRYTDPTTGATTPATGIQIAASLQTLQHSFYVQAYGEGPAKGTLFVKGSIAQRWRGAVGTGNGATGYFKNYSYDSRLTYAAPPYFPQWVNAVWGSKFTGEVMPRYRS